MTPTNNPILNSSNLPPPPPAPSFDNFQFKQIGQKSLLTRLFSTGTPPLTESSQSATPDDKATESGQRSPTPRTPRAITERLRSVNHSATSSTSVAAGMQIINSSPHATQSLFERIYGTENPGIVPMEGVEATTSSPQPQPTSSSLLNRISDPTPQHINTTTLPVPADTNPAPLTVVQADHVPQPQPGSTSPHDAAPGIVNSQSTPPYVNPNSTPTPPSINPNSASLSTPTSRMEMPKDPAVNSMDLLFAEAQWVQEQWGQTGDELAAKEKVASAALSRPAVQSTLNRPLSLESVSRANPQNLPPTTSTSATTATPPENQLHPPVIGPPRERPAPSTHSSSHTANSSTAPTTSLDRKPSLPSESAASSRTPARDKPVVAPTTSVLSANVPQLRTSSTAPVPPRYAPPSFKEPATRTNAALSNPPRAPRPTAPKSPSTTRAREPASMPATPLLGTSPPSAATAQPSSLKRRRSLSPSVPDGSSHKRRSGVPASQLDRGDQGPNPPGVRTGRNDHYQPDRDYNRGDHQEYDRRYYGREHDREHRDPKPDRSYGHKKDHDLYPVPTYHTPRSPPRGGYDSNYRPAPRRSRSPPPNMDKRGRSPHPRRRSLSPLPQPMRQPHPERRSRSPPPHLAPIRTRSPLGQRPHIWDRSTNGDALHSEHQRNIFSNERHYEANRYDEPMHRYQENDASARHYGSDRPTDTRAYRDERPSAYYDRSPALLHQAQVQTATLPQSLPGPPSPVSTREHARGHNEIPPPPTLSGSTTHKSHYSETSQNTWRDGRLRDPHSDDRRLNDTPLPARPTQDARSYDRPQQDAHRDVRLTDEPRHDGYLPENLRVQPSPTSQSDSLKVNDLLGAFTGPTHGQNRLPTSLIAPAMPFSSSSVGLVVLSPDNPFEHPKASVWRSIATSLDRGNPKTSSSQTPTSPTFSSVLQEQHRDPVKQNTGSAPGVTSDRRTVVRPVVPGNTLQTTANDVRMKEPPPPDSTRRPPAPNAFSVATTPASAFVMTSPPIIPITPSKPSASKPASVRPSPSSLPLPGDANALTAAPRHSSSSTSTQPAKPERLHGTRLMERETGLGGRVSAPVKQETQPIEQENWPTKVHPTQPKAMREVKQETQQRPSQQVPNGNATTSKSTLLNRISQENSSAVPNPATRTTNSESSNSSLVYRLNPAPSSSSHSALAATAPPKAPPTVSRLSDRISTVSRDPQDSTAEPSTRPTSHRDLSERLSASLVIDEPSQSHYQDSHGHRGSTSVQSKGIRGSPTAYSRPLPHHPYARDYQQPSPTRGRGHAPPRRGIRGRGVPQRDLLSRLGG